MSATEPSPAPSSTAVRDTLVLAGLTVTALALRISELGPSSLWVDDQWVAYIERVGFGDAPQVGLASVGFVVGLKAWFELVGWSELTAQIPAFVAGCVAPGLLYVFLRRWIDWMIAAGAAVMLTANELHIAYSYHVKQYTFDALWSVICVGAAIALVRRGVRPPLVTAVAVGALVAAIVSFTTAVASLGVFALVGWLVLTQEVGRDADRRLRPTRTAAIAVAWTVASGAAMAAWYRLVVQPNLTEGVRLYWSDHYVDRSSVLTSFRSVATRYVELTANTFNLEDHSVAAVIVAGACAVLIGFATWRSPSPMIVVVVPLAAAGVLAYLGRAPLGGGRTDLYLIVLLLVGVGGGLDAVVDQYAGRATASQPSPTARRDPARAVGAVVLSSAVLLVLFPVRPDPRPYPDNEVSASVGVIDARRSPSEAIVLHRSAYAYGLYTDRPSEPVSDNYHFQPVYPGDELVFRLPWGLDAEAAHRERLEQIAGDTDGIWLLSSPVGGPEEMGVFDRILRDRVGFELDERIVGQNVVLDHWVRPDVG